MIDVQNLSIRFDGFTLSGISFSVLSGEYGVMMGKTGCGKSTILEMICGLRKPDEGTIRLGDKDVTGLRPAERGLGYVPQDNALFPTMTVQEHFSFALKIRKWAAQDIDSRVEELAELLGLAGLLDRYPHDLSGGESQRVALGRALAFYPDVLCLDEPLSALDEETRGEMIKLLKAVRDYTGVTTLHVTHNLSEASRLADKVFRINDGHIVELTDFQDDF